MSPDQPWVAYAAVAIEPEEATSIIAAMTAGHKNLVQSGELKASNLLRSHNGRALASRILEIVALTSRWVVHQKRYAFAANFVEYVFEPPSQHWAGLANHGFHRFVANRFYEGLVKADPGGSLLERSFRRFMNAQDDGTFWRELEKSIHDQERSDVFRRIAFAALHFREQAESEVASTASFGFGKWLLDLSTTSMYGLLAALPTTRAVDYHLTRDHSKPLEALGGYFMAMNLPGTPCRRITKLDFADSKVSAGVQLADLLAGAAIYVKQEREGWEQLQTVINESADPFSVLPESRGERDDLNGELVHLFASYVGNGLDASDKFNEFVARVKLQLASSGSDREARNRRISRYIKTT